MAEQKDYIERKALRQAMQSVMDDPTCPLHIAATVDQYITEAPAAPVVERKHGEWVFEFNLAGSNFYRCSLCNRQEALLEKENIHEWCPFCHCGADMRIDLA